MVMAHETTLFDVQDCKVYPLTADVVGASPTYGAGVDVPGIAQVGLDPQFVTAVLKGDARTMARKGRVDTFKFTATYGKLAFDVLDVIMEGLLADMGTTPNQEVVFSMIGTNKLPYFGMEFVVLDTDYAGGDAHSRLWKCQLTGGSMFPGQTDNFAQPTMELEAIGSDGYTVTGTPPNERYHGGLIEIVGNETLVTL